MKISNTHQRLSNRLNNPEVLTNPEPFLGPNWETVLRWWLYYESLTKGQIEENARRIGRIYSSSMEYKARISDVEKRAADIVGEKIINTIYIVAYPIPFAITYELIANVENPYFIRHIIPEFINQEPTIPDCILTWKQLAEFAAKMPPGEPAIIAYIEDDECYVTRYIIPTPENYDKNTPSLFQDHDFHSDFDIVSYQQN
jgi:hypothetical protein